MLEEPRSDESWLPGWSSTGKPAFRAAHAVRVQPIITFIRSTSLAWGVTRAEPKHSQMRALSIATGCVNWRGSHGRNCFLLFLGNQEVTIRPAISARIFIELVPIDSTVLR